MSTVLWVPLTYQGRYVDTAPSKLGRVHYNYRISKNKSPLDGYSRDHFFLPFFAALAGAFVADVAALVSGDLKKLVIEGC